MTNSDLAEWHRLSQKGLSEGWLDVIVNEWGEGGLVESEPVDISALT